MIVKIKVWEPRYHDGICLVAKYKIPFGNDIEVEIEKGAYKGLYKVLEKDICESKIENMKTKRGKLIEMRAIPLSKLVRIS